MQNNYISPTPFVKGGALMNPSFSKRGYLRQAQDDKLNPSPCKGRGY